MCLYYVIAYVLSKANTCNPYPSKAFYHQPINCTLNRHKSDRCQIMPLIHHIDGNQNKAMLQQWKQGEVYVFINRCIKDQNVGSSI